MNTITWYLAPLELPLSYSSKANHKVQSSKFKVPRLLNRFSRLISFPEVRHTVSEDIVGMLLVIACQFYELDDLLGSLARQRLPEASHHTRYQRRGKRSSIIIDDAAPARNHAGRTSKGHHIRLDSAIRRRSYGTEGSIYAMFVDASTVRISLASAGKLIFFQEPIPSFPAEFTHTIPLSAHIEAVREMRAVLPSCS